MLITVTNNSQQAINTSLFSLDRQVQEVKKTTDAINDKLSGIDAKSGVIAVNGKQGLVELNASDVKALPDTTVIPTTTSQLINDSMFITINDVKSSFVPVTRKVNNKQLNTDITLTASDVGALPNTTVIPTTTSQLTNDSMFITSSDSITGNAATATRAEQDADGNVITDTYATKAELGNKVDKVSGKGLSTNDFTNAEKEKLAGLGNYDDSAVKTLIANETSERKTADGNLQTQITENKSAIDTLNGTGTGSVQKTVTDEIAKVVANAPEDFDTLKEISDWIDTHEGSASAMNTRIQANKNEIASLKTEVAGKSDIGHKHSAVDITSGILPIARGGTGQTTQAGINKAFVSELPEGTSDVTDGTMFVSSYASNNGFADTNAVNVPYKRKFSCVWEYIKGKISSVLGLTATAYGGKASTAGTADKTVNDISITIPYKTEHTMYVILLGNIPEPTSTAVNSPYNWDVCGQIDAIRSTGHQFGHIHFSAGHGYSHSWRTYVDCDYLGYTGIGGSPSPLDIKCFQYDGKWWLGIQMILGHSGYTCNAHITYKRNVPTEFLTAIPYYSNFNGELIYNEEINSSIQDVPSAWLVTRNWQNNISAPTFIGALSGNAKTATKATQDASGNVITDTYATKTALSSGLSGKSDTGHTHDDRYYTESEIDTKLSGKANSSHTHTKSQITDFPTSLPANGGTADKATKDGNGNNIADTYATKTDVPTKTSELTNDSNFISAVSAKASVDANVGTPSVTVTGKGTSASPLSFVFKNIKGDKGDTGYITSKSQLIDIIYPIGSVYISVNNVDPKNIFGGTWVQLKDRFLLGAGDKYSAGSTGGEATHTLTIEEMPRHSHAQNILVSSYVPYYDSPNIDSKPNETTEGSVVKTYWANHGSGYSLTTSAMQATGSSSSHNNMPPYLAVYMWKRTA